MCTECTIAFFLSPLKSGIVVLSFAIAIAALVMLRRLKTATTRQRLSLLFVHVFAFVFPFLFFAFFRGCQAYFTGCSQAKAVITMLGLTALISTFIAAAVAPLVFVKRQAGKGRLLESTHWNRFVAGHAEALSIKQPKIYVLNTAAPVAFSFSFLGSKIFLSAGLFDILSRKEIEAIMLHELAHIRNSASVMRLSGHVARLLSPFARLANFLGGSSIDADEDAADSFAAQVQGSARHLDLAKAKIRKFNCERLGSRQ